MFKVGDKVRCIQKSDVERFDSEEHYGRVGDIYTVVKDSFHRSIYLTGDGIREYGLIAQRFELVEETPVMSSNPAIEEYTKTVTVRKVRANTFPISFDSELKVIPSKNTVTLRFGNNRNGYGAKLKANELRTLAKQLVEIADVLDEQKG